MEKIKKIGIAFQILSNPEKKASYDKDLANMRNNELMSNLQKNTNSHNEELKKHSEQLANLYQVVVLNKIDSVLEEDRGKYEQEQFKLVKKSEKDAFVRKNPKNQVIKNVEVF